MAISRCPIPLPVKPHPHHHEVSHPGRGIRGVITKERCVL